MVQAGGGWDGGWSAATGRSRQRWEDHRAPLPSESSWTTHSEDTSSPSFGPSYTDLQFVSAGEQSGLASGADSTGKREPRARGLCKPLLVASHQISAASFVCRMKSGVVIQWRKPAPSVFQNCVGENTRADWLVGWQVRTPGKPFAMLS